MQMAASLGMLSSAYDQLLGRDGCRMCIGQVHQGHTLRRGSPMFNSSNEAPQPHLGRQRCRFQVLLLNGREAISQLYRLEVGLVSAHQDIELENLLHRWGVPCRTGRNAIHEATEAQGRFEHAPAQLPAGAGQELRSAGCTEMREHNEA